MTSTSIDKLIGLIQSKNQWHKKRIAKMMGFTRISLRNYEKGKFTKSVDNYFKLCYIVAEEKGIDFLVNLLEGEKE